jgi:SPP1 family predicted phage head-tail adaptor
MDTRARNRRVVIQQPSSTQDAAGQPLLTWSDVATVYANVRYLNGVETIKADAETAKARVSVRIGYRSDVTAAMRVLHGSTVYRIEAVLPDLAGKQHVDLACEVVS